MAKRGTNKALSVEQEEYVARIYTGRRSPSSGAAITDNGDVRLSLEDTLFECKFKGSPGTPLKRKPALIGQMEKIADEAWSELREPALQLRFYWPESPLASREGWIDFSVRLTGDDALRSETLRWYRTNHGD